MRKFAILTMLLVAASVVSFAQLSVRNLVLEGAEALPAEERLQVIREARSQDYRDGKLDDLSAVVQLAFQDLGYFKVQVDDPKIREVGSSHPRKKVDVVVPVIPGLKYSLKEISFSGNHSVTSSELRRQFLIRDGDVFSRTAIARGLEEIRRVYGTRGHLNFTSVPNPELDDINNRISINVDCDEGQQFRFGELILDGIEPYAGAGEQVLAEWQSYRGKVFDSREFEMFLTRHKKLFGEDPRFDSRDPHDGSMNIVVHFDQSVARN